LASVLNEILKELTKKELLDLACQKGINVPVEWSRELIIELLSLNISVNDIKKKKTTNPTLKPTGSIILETRDLVKKFDDIIAIDKLNLEVMEGELFSLLGPNGAGKTTTIKILTGILKPTTGNATIAGFNVTENMNEIKKLIGVCPQEAAVFQFLNAKENIELIGNLHSLSKSEIEKRTTDFLELLGLTEASKRKAGGYSGGMLRKLNIMMALINDPKIAFLDEPTVGMDARARRNTWEFIGSLKGENKTIILTTHYIEEAEALSDRVGIMDNGKLIEIGTPEELKSKYSARNLEQVFLNITGRRITEGL
jgi:ABC-2 type transport system ATP-binding protein